MVRWYQETGMVLMQGAACTNSCTKYWVVRSPRGQGQARQEKECGVRWVQEFHIGAGYGSR
jgi:hypothetical protein